MRNGYVSDFQASTPDQANKKHKHKGQLASRRHNNYHDNAKFPQSVQSSVQLQYPQPVVGRVPAGNKTNGVVYADLDMPNTASAVAKKNYDDVSHQGSTQKSQKSKSKTEYATLQFNDIGQEIDV